MPGRFPALAALLWLATPAAALDLSASLSVSPQWQVARPGSLYYVGPPTVPESKRALRQELAVRARHEGWNLQATLREEARQGQSGALRGIANELYYDGEIGSGVDQGVTPGQGFTIGKKVVPWGVGFGFRPLDVVQRENRRELHPPALVGIAQVAWEKLGSDDALTVLWQHPGGQGNRQQPASDDQALALHWYRLAGAVDVHGVARWSSRLGLEAGAGFSRIVGESWVFHGAWLQQQRSQRRGNALLGNGQLLASSNPWRDEQAGITSKVVAGVQWTGEAGLGLLLEAWYDGDAPSPLEWQRLAQLTARQRELGQTAQATQTSIDGNVAWSSQLLERANLHRQNILLRLSYDYQQRWKLAAEWLHTPADTGRALTLSLIHEGDRQRISGGLRRFGGGHDATFSQLPVAAALWLEWRYSLF